MAVRCQSPSLVQFALQEAHNFHVWGQSKKMLFRGPKTKEMFDIFQAVYNTGYGGRERAHKLRLPARREAPKKVAPWGLANVESRSPTVRLRAVTGHKGYTRDPLESFSPMNY